MLTRLKQTNKQTNQKLEIKEVVGKIEKISQVKQNVQYLIFGPL